MGGFDLGDCCVGFVLGAACDVDGTIFGVEDVGECFAAASVASYDDEAESMYFLACD